LVGSDESCVAIGNTSFLSFCSKFRSAFCVLCSRLHVSCRCVPVHFQIFSFCPNVCSLFSVLRSDPQNVRSANPGYQERRLRTHEVQMWTLLQLEVDESVLGLLLQDYVIYVGNCSVVFFLREFTFSHG
jgi:hypothetical protein